MNDVRRLGRVALALALPALLVAALALHGMRGQRIAMQARLGATFAGVRPVVVTSLRRGGPADHAGLAVGDVVETIDGHPAGSLAGLDRAVASGTPAAVRIRRGTREIGVIVW
ncbi:hypothetical protein GCM10022268_06760 [Sphingomonas cynarae]|uniref:PDZ domain-containing protein n=1 Tax=Sphingomonas cynarae TaxID=930197 RepID=A0ABP7D6Y1_9SPHN